MEEIALRCSKQLERLLSDREADVAFDLCEWLFVADSGPWSEMTEINHIDHSSDPV